MKRASHHWHVGIAAQGGQESYASIEHEHMVNPDRGHVHMEAGAIYTSPDLPREPLPEQLRDGFVRPLNREARRAAARH